jgi:transposase InsO family protein
MEGVAGPPSRRRWEHLRFSIIGTLLAAVPRRGEVGNALRALAERWWAHPQTGRPVRFAFSTLERWYYAARRQPLDPVAALRKQVRRDRGQQRALSQPQIEILIVQHREHPSWSYQLHHDNLATVVQQDSRLGPLASYSSVRRFMQAHGLKRRPRTKAGLTAGEQQARARLEQREVRSYEAECVNELWHGDFHYGSLPVLTPSGERIRPIAFGVLDDRSRLAGHVQWYLEPAESAQILVHGLCQAFQKRGLPGSLLTDGGPAMGAAETEQGLLDLGVVHATTLARSPYQNGKQENFWAQLEGRFMAMLENVNDLTLELLNQATQAWYELEYNRSFHTEIATTPLARYLAGPDVGRRCPSSEHLRLAFTAKDSRSQRASDGTLTIHGRRFEVPSRFRHLRRLRLRFARWDLSHVYIIDPHTDKVLDRLYPLDKARNADGRRRRLADIAPATASTPPVSSGEMAPLLKKLLAEHAATGLPPAYLPFNPSKRNPPTEQ